MPYTKEYASGNLTKQQRDFLNFIILKKIENKDLSIEFNQKLLISEIENAVKKLLLFKK